MPVDKDDELWKQIVCPACNGEGHFEGLGCSSCFGSGWWVKPKEAMQLIHAREAEARIHGKKYAAEQIMGGYPAEEMWGECIDELSALQSQLKENKEDTDG